MASSNNSIQSTSTPPSSPASPPMPTTTNVQEQVPVQGPNYPNFIPTPAFPRGQGALSHEGTALSHEGTCFRINSDGYIANLEGGRIDDNLTFTEKVVIMEIPRGCDIIHALQQFAQRNELSLCVALATGQVSSIEISYPNSTHQRGGPITGNFQLLAFSGTYYCADAATRNFVSCFNVTLATAQQGEFIGGLVAGRMTAGTVVTVFACITKE